MISLHDRRDKSDLEISVDSLRDEVRVLREVLDEIREALEWKNNNAADFPSLAEASFPAPSRLGDDSSTDLPNDVSFPAKQRSFF